MRTTRRTRSGRAGWGKSSGLRQSGRVLWIEDNQDADGERGLAEAGLDGAVAADCGRRTVLRGRHGGRWPSGALGGGLAAM